MLCRALLLLSKLIRILPYDLLLLLGYVFGNLYYLLASKQRERAISQMMFTLRTSKKISCQMVRKSFINLARNILEIFYMPNLTKKNLSQFVKFDHIERLLKARAEGNGVIVVTGHIGTWEWMSAACVLNGIPTVAIAKPQPNIEYTRALDKLRAEIGVEVINRGTGELYAAGRALKEGKILGFLIDQDAGINGAFVNFLGKVASTPMGAAVFSYRFNAPVIPMFILRQENGRHIIKVGEKIHFEDSDNIDNDLVAFTEKLNGILEKVIRENPTQWLWFQKRWNTLPEMQAKNKHHIIKRKASNQNGST